MVYLESDFRNTSWTFDIKSENPEAQVIFIHHIFLPGVELLPLVDVIFTHVTPEANQKIKLNVSKMNKGFEKM